MRQTRTIFRTTGLFTALGISLAVSLVILGLGSIRFVFGISAVRSADQPSIVLESITSAKNTASTHLPPLESITLTNAHRLTELAVLGRGTIVDLAWSPDGTTLALASTSGIVWLYDAQQLTLPPRFLTGHTAAVMSVTFSPDSKLLASVGMDATLRLWDIQTGEQRLSLESFGARNAVFSPDGQQVASTRGINVQLWDVATGAKLTTLKGHNTTVNSVAFSPDGVLLASASDDHTVGLWDSRTGALLHVLKGSEDRLNSVIFSPDGTIITAVGAAGTIAQWQRVSGVGIYQIVRQPTPQAIRKVVYSPNGKWVALVGSNQTLSLWDAQTMTERRRLVDYTAPIMSVAFSPDGTRLASVSTDETLRLWEVQTGVEFGRTTVWRGHDGLATQATFSPDGELLASVGLDSTVRLWQVATGEPHAVFKGHPVVVAARFNPDGKTLVSGSTDGVVQLWDVASGASRTLEGHTSKVLGVAFSPDGKTVASGSDDRTARLWDLATGESRILSGYANAVWGVNYSPDGQTLAAASEDGTVRLWDVATGALRLRLTGSAGGMRSVLFSPDGKLVIGGGHDGTVWLWNTATGTEVAQLKGHQDWVFPALNLDASLLITGSGDYNDHREVKVALRAWDIQSGTQLSLLKQYVVAVNGVEFNRAGTLFTVSLNDGTIRLWGVPAA